MSEHKFETFSYTPIELAASMTNTVNDTLVYLLNHGYIKQADYEYLNKTLAVFPMPNRKGFGQRLRERFFGTDDNQDLYVFPIIEIDPSYNNGKPKGKKPALNVVEGDFNKDKKDE